MGFAYYLRVYWRDFLGSICLYLLPKEKSERNCNSEREKIIFRNRVPADFIAGYRKRPLRGRS